VQQNRKEYVGVARFPLISVLGLAVTLLWLRAQVWNIMFLGLGLPGPMQRGNRGVQQLSSWMVAISVRAVAQKLHWLHSFPRGFGGPEGFPQRDQVCEILIHQAKYLIPISWSGLLRQAKIGRDWDFDNITLNFTVNIFFSLHETLNCKKKN
jgi:hypothetical protein